MEGVDNGIVSQSPPTGLSTLTAKRCHHYHPVNCRHRNHIYEMKHSIEQAVKVQGVQEPKVKREDLLYVREVKGYLAQEMTL